MSCLFWNCWPLCAICSLISWLYEICVIWLRTGLTFFAIYMFSNCTSLWSVDVMVSVLSVIDVLGLLCSLYQFCVAAMLSIFCCQSCCYFSLPFLYHDSSAIWTRHCLLSGLSALDVLRKDLKVVSSHNMRIAISSVPCLIEVSSNRKLRSQLDISLEHSARMPSSRTLKCCK